MAPAYNARAPVPSYRRSAWKIMLYVAIALVVCFGWIFSGVYEAVVFGCPLSDKNYCFNNWRPIMDAASWAFMACLCLSIIFFIVVMSLRCSPWYRGQLLRKQKHTEVKDLESQSGSTVTAHEAPSPISPLAPRIIYVERPSVPPAELPQHKNPVELSPDSIIEVPVNVNEKYRYDGDVAKSPQGMLEHRMY